MNLIEELQKHVSDDNIFYIEELADLIIDENINSLEELEENEKEYNSINGQEFSMDESIRRCIDLIDNYPVEYELCNYNDIQEIEKARQIMDSCSSMEKMYYIIKIFNKTNRENPFPYQTYKFIIEGKL